MTINIRYALIFDFYTLLLLLTSDWNYIFYNTNSISSLILFGIQWFVKWVSTGKFVWSRFVNNKATRMSTPHFFLYTIALDGQIPYPNSIITFLFSRNIYRLMLRTFNKLNLQIGYLIAIHLTPSLCIWPKFLIQNYNKMLHLEKIKTSWRDFRIDFDTLRVRAAQELMRCVYCFQNSGACWSELFSLKN